MNPDWTSRYEVMARAAQDAGRIALRYFPDIDSAAFASHVVWKSDNSPVTVADRDAETHLRKALLDAFPADGFLGEEFGDVAGGSGYRWIVDPIDGTRNFVRGIPLWATLIGLEYRGEVVAGVAYEPVFGHLYRALRGDGAYRGDKRMHVSTVDRLDEAMMFYSNINWFINAGKQDCFVELARRTQRQRGFGDYYGHLLVAQGSGDVMAEHGVHPWDIAAIKVIVEEAGGRFTDWSGVPNIHTPDVLVTNRILHQECLAILQGKF